MDVRFSPEAWLPDWMIEEELKRERAERERRERPYLERPPVSAPQRKHEEPDDQAQPQRGVVIIPL